MGILGGGRGVNAVVAGVGVGSLWEKRERNENGRDERGDDEERDEGGERVE